MPRGVSEPEVRRQLKSAPNVHLRPDHRPLFPLTGPSDARQVFPRKHVARDRRSILCGLITAALSATPVLAARPSFDFTGTWTGTATSDEGRTARLIATFASTGPATFTGSVTVRSVATCHVDGTRRTHVDLRVTCLGGRRTLRVHLARASRTLRGHFRFGGQRVRFAVTKDGA